MLDQRAYARVIPPRRRLSSHPRGEARTPDLLIRESWVRTPPGLSLPRKFRIAAVQERQAACPAADCPAAVSRYGGQGDAAVD